MKIIKALFSRAAFMVLMVIIEISVITSIFIFFGEQAEWIDIVLRIISLLIILWIIKNSRHLSSDMMWLVLIVLFPVAGSAIYLLIGADLFLSRTFRNIIVSTSGAKKYYQQDPAVLENMKKEAPDICGQFRYISKYAGFPFYENTDFSYYKLADEGYPVMLEEMKKAEKFIFLEYFIIEPGIMWNGMLEILEQKVKEGLDVRVMYDDIGSFMTLSYKYARTLEEKGIKCIPFNRINPILGAIMNHRDHRKIMVIDGKTAFSGGANLADEYINVKKIHGHWKDNIIRIKGKAVWSYTVMFLTHWNALRKTDEDFTVFRAEAEPGKKDGYIAAYGDTPLDADITAQNIYMGILNETAEYCYIMTPYLIIDTELINGLILAAQQGNDVRIITPGIPDKKIVWWITRSYYRQLIEGGVKIYEYSPGFVHSKVFVSDDRVATVGTVNLDYRSLYLHFENGTYLYGSEKVKEIRQDFLETCEKCHEVSWEESRNGFIAEFLLSVLRIFAPMM